MAVHVEEVDSAFGNVGQEEGLKIWRIENSCPVLVAESFAGKFFSGDSYVILKTTALKSGAIHHDVHYWLGKDTSQDVAGAAAMMTVELDTALGRRAVHYRELQGHESDRFLSYFKPCIIPLQGRMASEFNHAECNRPNHEARLYLCRGKHVSHVKEVVFARASLNHEAIFILDTKTRIFQFNGFNSSSQERAKALEVAQYIKDTYHDEMCEITAIDDEKLMADAGAGEFWDFFGGFAPLPKRATSQNDKGNAHVTDLKLLCVVDGCTSLVVAGLLTKELLVSDKCYVLDCGTEIFMWMGKNVFPEERKSAVYALDEMLRHPDRTRTHAIHVSEGFETAIFKSKFDMWPQDADAKVPVDGQSEVVALPEHQELNVKGLMKANPERTEPLPHIDCTGNLQVWRIDGCEKLILSSSHLATFYSGDCYIFEYSYLGEDTEEYLVGTWFGKNSIQDERSACISLATKMFVSLKYQAVQARIFQGKEPIQLFSIFQSLKICKGGISSGYKNFIAENGLTDNTYAEDGLALFQIRGYRPENMQAVQVEPVASSLNSSYCYILHCGGTVLTWYGSLTTLKDHDLLERMLDVIKPNFPSTTLNEGTETTEFWDLLGGRSEYATHKIWMKRNDDPHLFSCTLSKGNLKVTEIFNFTQDDLLTEDVFVLDKHSDIFVWVGNQADMEFSSQALSIGEKFLQHDVLLEKRSQETPVFIIMEGSEPSYFTCYFSSWDSNKTQMHGNSFQRKLTIINRAIIPALDKPRRRTLEPYGGRSAMPDKPRRSRSTSFSPDRVRVRGRSPVLNKLASAFENPSPRNLSNPPVARKLYPKSVMPDSAKVAPKSAAIAVRSSSFESKMENIVSKPSKERREFHGTKPDPKANGESASMNSKREPLSVQGQTDDVELEDEEGLPIFPYERLITSSSNPVPEIDVNRREAYLSASEFRRNFGMTKDEFNNLPKWKQWRLKMGAQLF